MNLKSTSIYKFAKSSYLSYVHFVCDAKRKPLINPLKDKLMRLNFRGG